ncbi:tail fiber protein [Lelliottia nimipressuralis]|uniref:tail fiber protein n=1 Tax=Lelliottia nimipressuralis TaxID=69220 RepID=UPI002898DA05|nr:tail fiber protein [Lelliottia nimipressuralis]
MTVKYKTVITKAGAEKLAAASVPSGKKVNFVAMAVGDGGGTLPEPNASQTKLVNEVWRHALNKISQDKKHKNYVVAELVIPPETGGFWLREMGLYDDTGTLIAVGNMAESYKPELAEGSGRAQTLRMVIMVSDIETVELSIDTTLVMATQDYVDDKLAEHEQSRRHPDATLKEKGFTQLSSATDSASETLAATPKAVKAVCDFASAKYTAQDATTAQKGIVQLSSATDSVSESLAATPKAVKAVYDFANAKYTAQDATTAQKGIVQLSSSIDSASETLAATPKAVKAANDNANGRVPAGRKVNGRELSADISVTAQDIFNGQAVGIGNALDLNSYITPGLYYQPANAQAQTGKNYPEAAAGSLEVYKHAGVTQIYRVYNNSRSYIRTLYGGVWTAWTKQYDVANKPTAVETGALPSTGGRVTGNIEIYNSAPIIQLSESDTGKKYFIVADGNGFRINEDTTAGNAVLSYAGASKQLRTVGQLIPGDWTNIDARYYTKAQSDAGYMPRTGAYTKAESDGRFQPKGSFAAPNSASKAANGWWQCGSTGIIEQWVQGATMTSETTQAITFPKAFPSACLSVSVSTLNANGSSNTEGMFQLISKTNTGCVVMANRAYGSIGQVAVIIQAKGY